MSDYGIQLREKQKVRRVYSVLERQFRNYFDDRGVAPGRHRREPAAPARDASRQRRLPHGLRHAAAPRRASSSATATSRSTACAPTSPRSASERATRSRSASTQPQDANTSRQLKDAIGGAQKPDWVNVDADKLVGTVDRLPTPRPDAARAQRAARGRVLLEVAPPHDRTGERPDRVRRGARDETYGKYEASPLRPATASPWATRCVASCSRPSRARPSRPSRSATSTRSSAPSPGVKEDVTQIVLNVKRLRLKSYVAPSHPAQAHQERRRPGHRGRHRRVGRRRDRQPRPAHPDARAGRRTIEMDLTVERGVGYLAAERHQGRPADRRHPGRRHLHAGAQGQLPRREHARRSDDQLRQADPRDRDRRHHRARRRRSRAPPRSSSSSSASSPPSAPAHQRRSRP